MNCTQFQKYLQDWLHSEFGEDQTEDMQLHLEHCGRCREIYAAEVFLQRQLRTYAARRMPRSLLLRIYWNIFVSEVAFFWRQIRSARIRRIVWLRYAVVAGVAAVLIFAISRWTHHRNVVQEASYSAQQIQIELDNVRFALSFVLYPTKKSENIVSREVLPNRVLTPLRNGIKTTIKSLKFGGKS